MKVVWVIVGILVLSWFEIYIRFDFLLLFFWFLKRGFGCDLLESNRSD